MFKKIVLGIVILLIIGIIASYFLAQNFVKSPKMREQILTLIQDATGRQAELGNFDLNFIPLSLEISNIKLKEKNQTDTFVKLDKLDVKINLNALLSKIIDIPKIVLQSPEINVIQFSDGTFNFSDMLQPTDKKKVKDTPKTEEPQKQEVTGDTNSTNIPVDLFIGKIQIESAKFKFTTIGESNQKTSFEIPNLDLLIKNISFDQKIDFELSIDIGQKSYLKIQIGIDPIKDVLENFKNVAKLPIEINNEIMIDINDLEILSQYIPPETLAQIPISSFKFKSNAKGNLNQGFQFKMNLSTSPAQKEPSLHLDIDSGFNLKIPADKIEQLMSGQFNTELISSIDFIFSGKINAIDALLVEGRPFKINCPEYELNLNNQSFKLKDLTLNHHEENIVFNLDILGIEPSLSNLSIKADLSSDKLSVHEFINSLPKTTSNNSSSVNQSNNNENTPNSETTQQQKPAVELDLRSISILQTLNLESNLSIKQLIYEHNIIDNLLAKITLTNGILKVNPASFNLFNGSFNQTKTVELLAFPIRYQSQLTISDIDIRKALQSNLNKSDIYGLFSAQLDINGQGTTLPNIEKYLNASGNITLKEAKIVSEKGGSFLDKMYLKLDNPLLISALPQLTSRIEQAKINANQSSETPINDCTIQLLLAAGKATINELNIGTPDYTLTANGSVLPFKDEIESLKAKINLSEEATKELAGSDELPENLPYENGGLMFPMIILGPLSNPKPVPDIAVIVQNLAKGQVKSQINKLLGGKDEGKKEGGLLGGLLGNKSNSSTSSSSPATSSNSNPVSNLLGSTQKSNSQSPSSTSALNQLITNNTTQSSQQQTPQNATASSPVSKLGGLLGQTSNNQNSQPQQASTESTSPKKGGLGGLLGGSSKKLGGLF